MDDVVARLARAPLAVYVYPSRPWLENERIHHMERHRRTKQWRGDWTVLGLAQPIRPALPVVLVVDLDVARRGGKLPDPHAMSPAVKAAVDGLVDAGVLPDDGPDEVLAIVFRAAQWARRDAVGISVHALGERALPVDAGAALPGEIDPEAPDAVGP